MDIHADCLAGARSLNPAALKAHADEPHARALLGALPIAVYTTDAGGRITFYNEAAAELWGRRPELDADEWCGSWRLYWPDGRPMPHDQCPMAVALRENREMRGAEAIAERPDGVRIPFLAYPTLLRDPSGAITGAVNTLVDISERKRAEDIAQRLASIVESSDDAIVSKNLDGVIMTWNRSAERLLGYTADEAVGTPITLIIPPDCYDQEVDIIARIRRGERIEHYETVRVRKDGGLIDLSLTVSPIRNASGQIVGASKVARDITERKRAEEQRNMLLREMSHRVKNVFAVASGVVALSVHGAQTPQEMSVAVRQRLAALARAQELTRPGLIDAQALRDQATTLDALIRAIFSPYKDIARANDGECFFANGPEVALGGGAVTCFALILHEFATNALKYGALASPTGAVHIDWSLEAETLTLNWRERGGPAVVGQPESEGFGSALARKTVVSALNGQLHYSWKPDGVAISVIAPLDRLGAG